MNKGLNKQSVQLPAYHDNYISSLMIQAITFNVKVYEHKFMNTIEATKTGPHQGH